MNHLHTIILAAGTGKRMGALTKDKSKALLHVGGIPIISYMLDFVKRIGSFHTIVVGGFHFNKIKTVVRKLDPSVELVENRDYEYQNLVSLVRGLDVIENEDLLVVNADYIFKNTTAEKIPKQLKGISIYCSFDLSRDDDDVMRVQSDDEGYLVKMSKQLTKFNSIYTGIFFIEKQYLPLIRKVIRDVFKKYDKNDATVEYIFRELLNQGHKITIRDVGAFDWFEFDTPEDLAKAQKVFRKAK